MAKQETPTRPEALASELSITGKALRAYLRRTFPRTAEQRNTAWELTVDQVNSAREHFAPKGE